MLVTCVFVLLESQNLQLIFEIVIMVRYLACLHLFVFLYLSLSKVFDGYHNDIDNMNAMTIIADELLDEGMLCYCPIFFLIF